MKKTIYGIMIFLSLITLNSCTPGETTNSLNGDESALPAELKGLKVYFVRISHGNGVYVAVKDNKILSTTSTDKNAETVVNINDEISEIRNYRSSDILLENDSILIIKKINKHE